jgi:hypothetical protein
LLFLVVFLVVFFLADDFLAFFAMALSPPFCTTNVKLGKNSVNDFLTRAHFFCRAVFSPRDHAWRANSSRSRAPRALVTARGASIR